VVITWSFMTSVR